MEKETVQDIKFFGIIIAFLLLLIACVALLSYGCYLSGVSHGKKEKVALYEMLMEEQSKAGAYVIAHYEKAITSLKSAFDQRKIAIETYKGLYYAERRDRQLKDRQIGMIENSLAELCRRSKIEPNLKIYFNRQKLEPWTPIRLFNAGAMPAGKFVDKNGYILPHHVKAGERAIFLGQYDCGAVLVYCCDGQFAGRILTFVPWKTYVKQGVLVYHF
ncbi:MAG: hypothetical protein PHF35_01645 [Candidatus Moranbacteria bacterium]|nr:hypothetical protein [Candidatus Moranbacteria bacterium]